MAFFTIDLITLKHNKISQRIGSRLKQYNQNVFNQVIEFTKNVKYIRLTSSETFVINKIGQEFKNLKNNTKSHAFLRSAVNSLSPLILIILFSQKQGHFSWY